MTHVLLTDDGADPPHTNARSLSNANAACPILPGDIAAFDVHTDTPSYICTDVESPVPPIANGFPLSVTILRSRATIGSDVIFVHDVTPAFDCSHDDTVTPPVVKP